MGLLPAFEAIVSAVTHGMAEIAATSMNVQLADITAVQTEPARIPLDLTFAHANPGSKKVATVVSILTNVLITVILAMTIKTAAILLAHFYATANLVSKKTAMLVPILTNAKTTTETVVRIPIAKMKPELSHVPARTDSLTKADLVYKKIAEIISNTVRNIVIVILSNDATTEMSFKIAKFTQIPVKRVLNVQILPMGTNALKYRKYVKLC